MSLHKDISVHLFWIETEDRTDPREYADSEALLSSEELTRLGRLMHEENRREFTFAHALARAALSRRAPHVAPTEWIFTRESLGRPTVDGPSVDPPLYFSISHTRGLVACVVAETAMIAVDVEDASAARMTRKLAERFCTTTEIEALRDIPESARRAEWARIWTLKESYTKARGLGLLVPPLGFSFVRPSNGPVRIVFGPEVKDDPAHWRFAERQPTSRHRVAVAAAAPFEGPWSLVLVEESFDSFPCALRSTGFEVTEPGR